MKQGKLKKRRDAVGWIFILPWLAGLLIFFAQPIVSLVRYSLANFKLVDGGYVLEKLSSGVFGQYMRALAEDPEFLQLLTSSVADLLYQAPILVFFCLFTALILNRDFHGRIVIRTIFFLPIIITSGVLAEMIQQNVAEIPTMASTGVSNIFDVTVLTQQLLESGMPSGIVNVLTGAVSNIADLVWKSGIQILVFLAALLSIPPVYYEVAKVEGASGWETFWKITFPIISPFVLIVLVYTIVDDLTSYSNQVMRYITTQFRQNMDYSYAAAMSLLYFIVILVLLGLVFLLCRRMITGGEKRA